MIFKYTQPKGEKDIKCNGDCMVRAVTNITKEDYNKVHKIMYGHGWRASRGSSKGKWEEQITKTLDELGFKFKRISFPGVKGQNRMTGKELSMSNPNSRYIIRVSKHVSVLDCGKLLDTWDCSDKCVYFVWEIIS
jgi:hypothetical protein